MARHRGRYIQRGSGVHRGLRVQRGSGLGSIFASILRKVAPVALRSAKRVAKSGMVKGMAKSARRSAVEMAKNAAINALEGKDIKAGAKRDLARARQRLGSSVRASLETQKQGTGGRRRLGPPPKAPPSKGVNVGYGTMPKASSSVTKGKKKARRKRAPSPLM